MTTIVTMTLGGVVYIFDKTFNGYVYTLQMAFGC